MTDHAAEAAAAVTQESVEATPQDFEAAVDREVAARVDAIERRWQSKKDREVHRERLRSQTAAAASDEEITAWVADADPADVGRWLKDKLAAPADSPPDPDATKGDEYVEGPADAPSQAAARQQLAEARATEPSPDLAPSMATPVDAFQSIEARFARGEIGLDVYEAARKRRGLD
ncbi:MAG: hypothetical protein OXG79_02670 [Chloroflexi bacterium]|nr:hypothetical protein [Chloroflexota bacterium]